MTRKILYSFLCLGLLLFSGFLLAQEAVEGVKNSVIHVDSATQKPEIKVLSREDHAVSDTVSFDSLRKEQRSRLKAGQKRQMEKRPEEIITTMDYNKYLVSRRIGIGLTFTGVAFYIASIGTGVAAGVLNSKYPNGQYSLALGAPAFALAVIGTPILIPGAVTWNKANKRIKKVREL